MIAAPLAAKTAGMGVDKLSAWFDANRDGLLVGLIVALVIVGVMLLVRGFGRRTVERDPDGWGWRTVIGGNPDTGASFTLWAETPCSGRLIVRRYGAQPPLL